MRIIMQRENQMVPSVPDITARMRETIHLTMKQSLDQRKRLRSLKTCLLRKPRKGWESCSQRWTETRIAQ